MSCRILIDKRYYKVFSPPVPYHINRHIYKVVCDPSRESLIYKNNQSPSHVTEENNTKLFVSSRMRLDRRNYSVFTFPPISHNRETCNIVCDPSHVMGEPSVQNLFLTHPIAREITIQNSLWLVPCHGRKQFKIIFGPSQVTAERAIQNYSCPVACYLTNEIAKCFTSCPISHNRQTYKVVCDPSHVTGEPNVQKY